MRINISYSPPEEAHVLRITGLIRRIFPAAAIKFTRKEKYKYCYIDTAKKRAENHNI